MKNRIAFGFIRLTIRALRKGFVTPSWPRAASAASLPASGERHERQADRSIWNPIHAR